MKPDKIKIGDVVNWCGNFGTAPARPAIVTEIELCQRERDKYGTPVNEIYTTLKNFCVFSLDTGNWAYGSQIEPIEQPQPQR